jgi:hypothetical protein
MLQRALRSPLHLDHLLGPVPVLSQGLASSSKSLPRGRLARTPLPLSTFPPPGATLVPALLTLALLARRRARHPSVVSLPAHTLLAWGSCGV